MILCIETATKNCSVAIVSDSRVIAQSAERSDKFVHGERLHLIVQECMQTAGLDFSDIQGVCVGKGPGSYTGLRIGVSAAKGICYAAKLPLYSLPTLGCFDMTQVKGDEVIAVIDARRDEVYAQHWVRKEGFFHPASAVEAVVVTENSWQHLANQQVQVIGDAAEKVSHLHDNSNWIYAQNAYPSAKDMANLLETPAMVKEDVAYFEPYYLKDFVALKSTKKLL